MEQSNETKNTKTDMRKKLFLSVCLALLSAWALASRVKIEWKTYQQPDGSVLTLTMAGDESFSYFLSPDGKMYEQDAQGVFHILNSEQTVRRAAQAAAQRRLPALKTQWDPNRVYRQAVILVSFSDTDFFDEDPQALYNNMFNTPGYNHRNGAGCVAEYFREQSGGMCNLQFDVYGPFKTDKKAQPYANPNSSTRNYGKEAMIAATRMFVDTTNIDFSVYDWDNDGAVDQIVYVFAGFSGNQGEGVVNGVPVSSRGYVWPNTGTFTTITTKDGKKISNYSNSCELWLNSSSCGIGTICHEYSHSLGLPDVYPTVSNGYVSVVDEWDLMDGGNYTNYGWCPPNFTPLEKMLLGWLTPIELSEPQNITGMKSVSDGGEVYQIKHTDTEYYLLENRQHKGWDYGAPGQGLVVYHVDYSQSAWRGNTLNNVANHFRFDIVHADGLDYNAWDKEVIRRNLYSPYVDKPRLHNIKLSTSPYPWTTDSTEFVNNLLTDSSAPASLMYNANGEGANLLSKAITDIEMSADGLISFKFMGGVVDGIGLKQTAESSKPTVFDLNGRQLQSAGRHGLFIVRQADGTVRKIVR